MKALEHLRTINHHKWLVMKHCFKVGLYKQGLLHDMSKYTPTEFLVGCRYYQGNRSPNNAEREVPAIPRPGSTTRAGISTTMNTGWITVWIPEKIVGQKMPIRYAVEMFMDRVAASKTYMGDRYTVSHPLKYYEQGAEKLGKMIHPETAALLRHLLEMLAEKGEEETFRYIRKEILKNKK